MPHLDGNVLAGPAQDLFAVDLTTVAAQCDSCGQVAMLADAMVYGAPMGFVARCHSCGEVLLTIVERAADRIFQARGVRSMRIRFDARA
jgi:uncharacterized Zn finger protein